MNKIIYVKLLNEGTVVFRPVESFMVTAGLFRLGGHDIYDANIEEWEFVPGTVVRVVKQELEGESVLVADRACGVLSA